MVGNYLDVQTQTLPQGRLLFGYNQLNQKLENEFNGQGHYDNFSQNRHFKLRASTLINNDKVRGPVLGGLLHSYGIQQNDEIGSYALFIEGQIKAEIFIAGYGLTDRLGLYLTFPYLSWRTRLGSRFSKSQNYAALLQTLNAEGQFSTSSDLDRGTQQGVEYALVKEGLGPNALVSEGRSLGDVQLNFKYVLPTSPEWGASLDPFLVLPTSAEIDGSKIVPLAAGDRRWAVGGNHGLTYTQGIFQTGFSYGLKYFFPARTKSRRVVDNNSESRDDSFALDENIRVSEGTTFNLHLNQSVLFSDALKFSGGADFQKRESSRFEGNLFDEKDYDLMSDYSRRQLLIGYLAVQYNTINLFLKKKFLMPLQVATSMQWPLSGKNTFADATLTNQIYFYF